MKTTITFCLQYKHSGTFDNRKHEEYSHPQQSENVRPHSSNSIENATPSSGTSPLAFYQEVPPPPPPGHFSHFERTFYEVNKLQPCLHGRINRAVCTYKLVTTGGHVVSLFK